MWFKRMTLEVWFDDYQYAVDYDIGESAVKFMTVDELDIDLQGIPLRYGHHTGNPALRECIADQYPGLSSENVIVTTGASEAIFTVASAIVEPGDHVIVEHPNYPSLYTIPRGLGCHVSLLTLAFEDRFKPDLDKLRDLITPQTKLISFTHPNNPTGSMISVEELHALVDLIEEYDIYLLFDETYREMDFAHSLPPAATLSDHAISISTMSKAYGLPGIRIGWIATKNRFILDSVLAIREQISIANNSVGEEIALHVLQRKDAFLHQARAHIERNRQTVSDWMDEQEHFEWIYPEAGVVSFPRIKHHVQIDPEELYRLLAERYKTFTVPGRCFEKDNRHFRLGFGATHEEIEAGVHNINLALGDLA
jgi:aspartate/methionine/tyrosine aminotransferase